MIKRQTAIKTRPAFSFLREENRMLLYHADCTGNEKNCLYRLLQWIIAFSMQEASMI